MAKDTEDRKQQDGDEAEIGLDMSQTAVKKMIAEARVRGYITYDQLNTVLPPEQVSSEQIEDVMSMLSEMGINVIEDDEAEEDPDGAKGSTDLVETSSSRDIALSSSETEKLDRTDDPVRMYLREMGSVELLSREGEIAIAKRIEAGRNTMIAGLCESPLTFQAITIWRDELLDEDILLRDVIDLDATFGRSLGEDDDEPVVAPVASAKPAPTEGRGEDDQELDADGNPIRVDDDEDEDEQANMSLAAMEAALKPRVLDILDRIAADYVKLSEMQDARISATLNEDRSFSTKDEDVYQQSAVQYRGRGLKPELAHCTTPHEAADLMPTLIRHNPLGSIGHLHAMVNTGSYPSPHHLLRSSLDEYLALRCSTTAWCGTRVARLGQVRTGAARPGRNAPATRMRTELRNDICGLGTASMLAIDIANSAGS